MDADSNYTNQDPDLKNKQEADYQRREYILGLRALADWYEQNPEVVTLADSTLSAFPYYELDSKEFAAKVARAMMTCEKKVSDGGLLYLKRKFHGITLQFLFDRNIVCERRVVGKRQVPAEVIPERVIEAHEEDIVEWDCGSLLAPTKPDNRAPGHDPVNQMLIDQGKISDF